jgi:hypothetical protein
VTLVLFATADSSRHADTKDMMRLRELGSIRGSLGLLDLHSRGYNKFQWRGSCRVVRQRAFFVGLMALAMGPPAHVSCHILASGSLLRLLRVSFCALRHLAAFCGRCCCLGVHKFNEKEKANIFHRQASNP